MRQYRAHALGIGWKESTHGQQRSPALLFYISPQDAATIALPDTFAYTPSEAEGTIDIPAQLIISPSAQLE